MKQQIAAGILALSMVGGVGTGVVAHQLKPESDEEPKAKPSATATTKKADKPKSTKTANAPAGDRWRRHQDRPSRRACRLPQWARCGSSPGAVGPVQVGMSKAAAYATGYFDSDVSVPACNRVDDLGWRRATTTARRPDPGRRLGLVDRDPGRWPAYAFGPRRGQHVRERPGGSR